MKIKVVGRADGLDRAFNVILSADNGNDYSLMVHKSHGTLYDDGSYFKSNIPDNVREDYWNKMLDTINEVYPEEKELSKGIGPRGFDQDQVYVTN